MARCNLGQRLLGQLATNRPFPSTVESRFLEPPRETKDWFEKSKVASNVAKLLRYCFIEGNHAHFRSNI